VFCADRWHYERERIPRADRSPTVLVNLAGENVGGPMRVDHVISVLSDLSRRAGLDRTVTPHSCDMRGRRILPASRIWRS